MERPDQDFVSSGPLSHCDVSLLEGTPFTLWAPADVETKVHEVPRCLTQPHEAIADIPHYVYDQPLSLAKIQFCLQPGRLIVIGRANGHKVPYLDPAYQATTVVPDTGQSVLGGVDKESDNFVSRAHFTLRAVVGGIVFTNGVPGLDGGIRPPTNWTYLVDPVYRTLWPAEEVVIEAGTAIAVRLPNRCVIRLGAR